MRIYRIEHQTTGKGPYSHGWHSVVPSDARQRPDPSMDGLQVDHQFRRFGFLTLHALRRWFGGIMPALHQAGFILCVYEASDYQLSASEKQVMFNIDGADCVDRSDLVSEQLERSA